MVVFAQQARVIDDTASHNLVAFVYDGRLAGCQRRCRRGKRNDGILIAHQRYRSGESGAAVADTHRQLGRIDITLIDANTRKQGARCQKLVGGSETYGILLRVDAHYIGRMAKGYFETFALADGIKGIPLVHPELASL